MLDLDEWGYPVVTRQVTPPILVDARDATDAGQLDPLFDWFQHVDRTFSTYRPDSAISRLNLGELELADADRDVREVLDRCEQLRTGTGGYFDMRAAAADQLDPSGLVKGWSVDRAAAIADGLGRRNYAINAGGDIRLRGGSLPEPVWSVGIQHPRERDRIAAVIEATDLAIATSGTYARRAHIVNPHTRCPPSGVLSVTITGPDLGTADALATAVFAMGDRGPAWTPRLRDFEAMTLLADGRSLRTAGFAT